MGYTSKRYGMPIAVPPGTDEKCKLTGSVEGSYDCDGRHAVLATKRMADKIIASGESK